MISLLTGALSIGLAVNIGANNSAAEMGPAYGANVRSRREAVGLIAVFCIAGAVLAGHRVMDTIGHRLVGSDALSASPSGVLIVVVSALCLIGLANVLRVPLATSHAIVGAVVGLGLFVGTVNRPLVLTIVAVWIATPLLALGVAYGTGRYLYPRLLHAFGRFRSETAVKAVLAWSVTLSSCWMAFAAGSNSLAKAMGPAVGAGVFPAGTAAVVGGIGMAVGALLLGGRMIHIVGKEITAICPLCAVLVQVISAMIVIGASRYGMPVSLAEIVTCSVIGFSCASRGFRGAAQNPHVRRMLVLWPAAPVGAGLMSFTLLAVG
jgi:phosphate/sulfate permease